MADLPKPLPASEWQHDMWTAAQLEAYAAAKVAEERERCARLVEATLPTAWPKEVAAAIRGTEAASA